MSRNVKHDYADMLERINRYEAMKARSEELQRDRLSELVSKFNEVLKHCNCPQITSNHIRFFPQHIGNTGYCVEMDKLLSRIIYDHYYEPAESGRYYHYTSIEAFKSIVDARVIRLSSPLKRIKDAEYSHAYDIYRNLGLKTLEDDPVGFRNVMSELFYISLVKAEDLTSHSAELLWERFGGNHTGVRLTLDIQSDHLDFRRVLYSQLDSNSGDDLVSRLSKVCEMYELPLVFASISKFGAFYIRSSFSEENETRFLLKKGSDDYPLNVEIIDDGEIPHIELELDRLYDWGMFRLVEVQPGQQCCVSQVEDIAKSIPELSVLSKCM
jgi:hypothetical protein